RSAAARGGGGRGGGAGTHDSPPRSRPSGRAEECSRRRLPCRSWQPPGLLGCRPAAPAREGARAPGCARRCGRGRGQPLYARRRRRWVGRPHAATWLSDREGTCADSRTKRPALERSIGWILRVAPRRDRRRGVAAGGIQDPPRNPRAGTRASGRGRALRLPAPSVRTEQGRPQPTEDVLETPQSAAIRLGVAVPYPEGLTMKGVTEKGVRV